MSHVGTELVGIPHDIDALDAAIFVEVEGEDTVDARFGHKRQCRHSSDKRRFDADAHWLLVPNPKAEPRDLVGSVDWIQRRGRFASAIRIEDRVVSQQAHESRDPLFGTDKTPAVE